MTNLNLVVLLLLFYAIGITSYRHSSSGTSLYRSRRFGFPLRRSHIERPVNHVVVCAVVDEGIIPHLGESETSTQSNIEGSEERVKNLLGATDLTSIEISHDESIMDENIRTTIDMMLQKDREDEERRNATPQQSPDEILKDILSDKTKVHLLQNTTQVLQMLYGDVNYKKDPFDEVFSFTVTSLLAFTEDICYLF